MVKEKEKKTKDSYTAKDIYVLEGLEPVRKRPAMYIGSTGTEGLHHLVWEVVDNSIDEAMAGYAKNISVVLLPGNKVRVVDDGRGIPVEIHKQTKKSALETVMTTLHAGAKFGGESYKIAGGLHGVGVSVVNALSIWMRADVCRDNEQWVQEYERGKAKSKVKKIGKCGGSGTSVTFEPDPEIFKDINFNWDRIIEHLRQQAYLMKGLKIKFSDQRQKDYLLHNFYTFYFEGGLRSYVDHLNSNFVPKHSEIFYVGKAVEEDKMFIEVALQYVEDYQSREVSFANNIYTQEGGMHITGFRTALTRVLNDYARKNNFLKAEEENLSGDDVREGLTAVISIKLREPQFEGQTKAKLGNTEARSATDSVFSEAFSHFLEEHPQDSRAILEKVILALKARKAAKAAKENVLRKGALEGLTLPGKLADCQSRDPAESELFIVEGDSAGGCFSGDTEIALVDGRNITFEKLVEEHKKGKRNYCYTIDKDGNIRISLIENPRITKRRAEVIKIVLDNDKEIICTPDHKFMLRDGGYKEAKDLKPAVLNYNHRIKRIILLKKKIDVYDIEVTGTHNFALAGGIFVHNSSKQGRDRRTQAVLPLKGKILNVERSRLDKMLINNEIKALVTALGASIADDLNIEKLRYHSVIIATDADVDGAHIRTLLLTLLYRYYRPVVDAGYIYIAQPPLYRIQYGKDARYAYSDSEKDKIVKEIAKAGANVNIQRYKGLGEMNPIQLWETTMDPNRRVLKRVTIDDAKEADKAFDILMGKEVEPRRLFIETHAKAVQNLDV